MKNNSSRLFWIVAITALSLWALFSNGLKLGLDLEGGSSLTYRVFGAGGVSQEKLAQAIEVIQKRLDTLGVSEVYIVSTSADELVVEMPGRSKEETESIKSLIQRNGELQFRIRAPSQVEIQDRESRAANPADHRTDPKYAWFPLGTADAETEILVEVPEVPLLRALEDLRARGAPAAETVAAEKALEQVMQAEVFTGEDLSETYVSRNGAATVVAFATTDARKASFGSFTSRNVGRQMAIILDGKVQSYPIINEELPGRGQISGGGRAGFSVKEARDLVVVLESGSTGVRLELIREETLGPSLGAVAIETGKLSIVVGFVGVVLIVLWFYRFPGLIANLALLLNVVIMLGAMAFFRGALSLPGIAGIVLTVGMAVDANILIFERLRDERNRGKSLEESLAAGYDRAMSAIVDSNVTTVLTAIVLIFLGTGAVRGFGVTLTIGLCASMFTAIFVTRTVFETLIAAKWMTRFEIGPDPKVPSIDYMRVRPWFTIPSLVLMAGSLVFFLSRDESESKDIEFVGGQQVVVQMNAAMPASEFLEVAQGPGRKWESATPVRLLPEGVAPPDDGSTNRYQVRVKASDEDEGRRYVEHLRTALGSKLMPAPYTDWSETPAAAGAGRGRIAFVLNTVTPVADPAPLTAAFAAQGLKGVSVERIDGSRDRALRVACDALGDPGTSDAAVRDRVRKAAESLSPPVTLSDPMPSSSFLKPSQAEKLWRTALQAVLISLLIQVAYIRLRFADYTHGFAAVLALVHDALIALGAVAVFDAAGLVYAKINLVLIASFLTLIGFSMNDTIVIFDRIRENLGRSKVIRSRVINDSVNQTIVRSIRTSLTTWFVVLVQFVLNRGMGSVLEGFAWVMVIGCIAGAYSTIFIASPILLFLPGYGQKLTANRRVFVAMVISTVVGTVVGVTATGHGPAMWAGVALALALPVHFLVHFVPWLWHPDPDSLVQDRIDAEDRERPLAAPGI